MTAVVVRGVEKGFAGQPVLRGVDLDVADGGVLALLGPSGCGKTTLLRLLAGFERADSGEIRFGGARVAGAGLHLPPERRRIGYVPQDGSLFPHLTVAGNIGYGLRGPAMRDREARAARIAEVVALTALDGLEGRYPHQLSGGQQQRVALARALAPRPALVLLDEPFNALDLDLRRAMCMEVVALLRRAGATAVLVTHDPGEAFACADRVAAMLDGRIMQCAGPETVYRQPASAAVARLTGQATFVDGVAAGERAATRLGPLPLRNPGWPQGTRLRVMLRPEQLAVARDAAGAAAGVPVRVLACSFRGDHSVVSVDAGGLVLSARAAGEPLPAAHQTARLTVAGACMAFPSE